MATISRIRPHLPETFLAAAAPRPIAPAAVLLVAMAAGGLGLTVLGRPPTTPEAPPPATVTETEAAVLPRGDLPIIGDPIRDLTIWWSNRLTDANRAGLDSLRGRALTPIDPMADDVVKTLYASDNQRWSESKLYFLVVWSMVSFGILTCSPASTSRSCCSCSRRA